MNCGFLSTPFLTGILCEWPDHTMVRAIIIGGVSLMDGRTMTNYACTKLPYYQTPAARFHSYPVSAEGKNFNQKPANRFHDKRRNSEAELAFP